MGTSGADTTLTFSIVFDLAVNRYGFDYPVFDEDNGDGVDVDVSNNKDDTIIENDDEEIAENVPLVAQTRNREREDHPHSVRLRGSQEVPFQRLQNVRKSVIRSFLSNILELI